MGFNSIKRYLIVVVLLSIAACSDNSNVPNIAADLGVQPIKLDVFKSPTCGCCAKWVDHISLHGFNTAEHLPSNLQQFKLDKGIAPRYQSCHTGVSKEGYVFEGHIPAEVMKRFLLEKPAGAIGLSVPGMPVGSPGMEMGERYDDYNVLLLMKDGTAQVYHKVRHASES
ncbi:MAG: DUF411 domain-containing protein [Cycloclasticus sp.]|nr:DUF411 domain-containing protein [Cycloclasticus sp.]